jgi:dTDP-4-dehydrorhamnose reductase
MVTTVLITGSNGLVGQKVTNLLSGRPAFRVVCTGLGSNRNESNTENEYYTLDISQFSQLQALFHKVKPDVVINTAAMTNVDQCESEQALCHAINVNAVKYLCGLCLENQARLIHISTDFIFDGTAGPYQEQDQPNPLSVYGRSKLDAEEIFNRSQVKGCILRTVLVYGYVKGLSRSNIVLWVKESLEQGKSIRVVTDQFRTPTLADDLASGIVAAIVKNASGVFHISGSELISVFELAQKVAQFWKLDGNLIVPIDSNSLQQPAQRPPKTGFIILKAQTELGYKPTPLTAGLQLLDRQLKGLD